MVDFKRQINKGTSTKTQTFAQIPPAAVLIIPMMSLKHKGTVLLKHTSVKHMVLCQTIMTLKEEEGLYD